MAALRGASPMRGHRRYDRDDDDGYRHRADPGEPTSSSARRRRSPASARGSKWEVKASDRDIDATSSTARARNYPRQRSRERHHSDRFSSPELARRNYKASARASKHSKYPDEPASDRRRVRNHHSPPTHRHRSRSASPQRTHRKAARSQGSKSPPPLDASGARPRGMSHRHRDLPSRRSPDHSSRFSDQEDQPSLDRERPKYHNSSSRRGRSRSPRSRFGPPPPAARRRSRSPHRRPNSKRAYPPRRHPDDRRTSISSRDLDIAGRGRPLTARERADRGDRLRDRHPHPSRSRTPAGFDYPRERYSSPPRPGYNDSGSSRGPSPARSRSPFPRSPPLRDTRRSPSHESRYRGNKMQDTRSRSAQSGPSEGRPPSPLRPIPSLSDVEDQGSFDGDARIREAFPLHGMKASDIQHAARPPRPHIDTRQSFSTSPPYLGPTPPHHISPQSGSPYANGRGGWAGQQPPPYHPQHGYSPTHQGQPPFRQSNYSPTGPPGSYYPSHAPPVGYPGPPNHQMHPGYQPQSFRGGHAGYRGNHYGPPPDRRFSGSGPQGYPPPHNQRGRGGHFNNLSWTAPGRGAARGQYEQPQGMMHHHQSPPHAPPQLTPQRSSFESAPSNMEEEDNPFRPSKDLQVEDQSLDNNPSSNGGSPSTNQMPPPTRPSPAQPKEGPRFSFAFKSKAPPAPTTPKADLSQKVREPLPRRDTMLSEGNKSKHHPRPRSTERIGKSRADFRTERKHDFDRRSDMDRRHDRRSDYRGDYRSDRRPDYHRSEVRPEPRPEPRMEKRIMKRLKPRPTLPADFAASDSVYYRKPGNESVIGSGTYGKVFKAVHVYTKKMVALKRIRMEGERDGFPVTAIREIKLLQSLKHENVVSLQEVMVEKNDCFMVFEYLSHDLTGLLNHPSFKLEHAHKKHLAKQLFEGLDYLHRRGVLHRDIKAANILISNTGQLKLADFGLARFFAKRRQLDYTNRVITIWYRSPELLLGETQYGPAVDIWSAACVLVEIFTKHAIFPGDGGEINQLDKIYNILGTPTVSEWPSLVDMAWFELLRPTEKKPSTFAEKYKERLTPAAFDLLSAMFAYDPVKRPDASEVLKHPYFTIEEPTPRSPAELENLEGDWHEFESKALRRENERRDKEARRALREEQYQKEKEKRRASANPPSERDPKRQRAEPPSANFHQQ